MSRRLQTLSTVTSSASRGVVAYWHSGVVAQIIGHDVTFASRTANCKRTINDFRNFQKL